MIANLAPRNFAAALLAVVGILWLALPATRAEDVTLTVWSHEADEDAKVAFREMAARNLEKTHPGVHVKITWFEKNPLLAALKTALPAGQGPDVLYVEPDWTEYVTAGYLAPLDDLVDWKDIQDWARKVWVHDGKTYGLPQEAYTNEIYYHKDILKKLGVELTPRVSATGRSPAPISSAKRFCASSARTATASSSPGASRSRTRASSRCSNGPRSWLTPAPIPRTS